MSKNTSKKEVKSQTPYRIAGPVTAIALIWYFRSNSNFDDTNAQCFTEDAFEAALQKNVTQNITSLTNNTGGDIISSDDNAEVIYIETTIGEPINLNHLSEKQIIDIKQAFNTTTGQEDSEPELCPSVSAAFSSRGVFVQFANIASIALKQLLSFFWMVKSSRASTIENDTGLKVQNDMTIK